MKAHALPAILLALHEVCPTTHQQGMRDDVHVLNAIAGVQHSSTQEWHSRHRVTVWMARYHKSQWLKMRKWFRSPLEWWKGVTQNSTRMVRVGQCTMTRNRFPCCHQAWFSSQPSWLKDVPADFMQGTTQVSNI